MSNGLNSESVTDTFLWIMFSQGDALNRRKTKHFNSITKGIDGLGFKNNLILNTLIPRVRSPTLTSVLNIIDCDRS
jgi:hypothetical protein